MTPYDDILDLALISIEDYRLNKLAVYIEKKNYDLLIESTSYAEYVAACSDESPVLIPVTSNNYTYIKGADFASYNEYVDDCMTRLKLILEGFMKRGLPNFNNCKKDLDDYNDEARQFNVELNNAEKSIIADWTVIMWLEKEINDTRQLVGMLQNKNEARRYSEANLLKEKSERSIVMRENVGKKQTDYSFKYNIPWQDWADGKYGL